ncbi:MAG TPA: class I SAM-dependent methyltransferase [Acidimicrobiales bacterium]|nr:class I SAM-dependent methyltransferase [Acidimicrobiales bacterium]
MSDADGASSDLRAEVGSIEWYHTIELAPGVVTPGWHDTRSVVAQVPFPASLAGKRCLDVGTFDGFWAFEMERRGASEIVAVDVPDPKQWDWPVVSSEETRATIGSRKAEGRGFHTAHRALASKVQLLDRSVYDIDESDMGKFDLVYLGSLLVHLRDPIRALERLRDVCSGTMIVVDGIELFLSLLLPNLAVATFDGHGRPWWWYPNQAGLRRMVEAGGFEVLEGPKRIFMPPGAGQPLATFDPKLLASREGRRALVIARRGDPHAVLVARPVR